MIARLRLLVPTLFLSTSLVTGGAAFAQTIAPSPSVSAEARERFDRGIKLFNDGENAGALAEFERAYALIPNTLVLYNIGLVHAAMGRPVPAVDALDRVIANPGPVNGTRLTHAKEVRDEQLHRIAELVISSSVPATIDVDGVQVGQSPLSSSVKIASGVHIVGAAAAGYAAAKKEVTVAGGDKIEVRIDLIPLRQKTADLAIRTHVPHAEVVVDDKPVGVTPLVESLTLPVGPHRIELRRPGYRTARQDTVLVDGTSGEMTLEPEEDEETLPTLGGTLSLDISEPGAVISIDGRPRGAYEDGIRLPPGPHSLIVSRSGFEPLAEQVNIDSGRTTSVQVNLEPTSTTRAAYISRVSSRRTIGFIVGGTGLAIAGVSAVFLVWNKGQENQAASNLATAENNLALGTKGLSPDSSCNIAAGGNFNECNAPITSSKSDLDNANGRDPYGYAGVAIGAAVAAVGVYILLSGDNPHRYDKNADHAWLLPTITPYADGSLHGGSLGFKGTF